MTPKAIESFFVLLKKSNPNPKSELNYYNIYTLLVAVILSAQATDSSVNKATKKLFLAAKTPEQMIKLGLPKIKRFIRTIGLYNTKAKNIFSMSQILIKNYGGQVPHQREELEALPGVGRKTANVVMNIAFGLPTIAVDTHVFRVANRTGLAQARTPRAVEEGLLRVIPEAYKQLAHHWLIFLGRYICTARKPKCPQCQVEHLCGFKNKTKRDSVGLSSF